MKFVIPFVCMLLVGCAKQKTLTEVVTDQMKQLTARQRAPKDTGRTLPPPFPMHEGPKLIDKSRVATLSAKISTMTHTDIRTGSGPVADGKRYATVWYRGELPDGFVFDTNLKPGGQPFTFQLSIGSVIEGWREGVKGMRVGGVRKLVIPAKMAYGANAQPTIPANSALIFYIQLVFIGDRA